MYHKAKLVGPLNAQEFLRHVKKRRLKPDTPVRSLQYTGNQWITMKELDLPHVQATVQAEQDRRESERELARQDEEQRRDLAHAENKEHHDNTTGTAEMRRSALLIGTCITVFICSATSVVFASYELMQASQASRLAGVVGIFNQERVSDLQHVSFFTYVIEIISILLSTGMIVCASLILATKRTARTVMFYLMAASVVFAFLSPLLFAAAMSSTELFGDRDDVWAIAVRNGVIWCVVLTVYYCAIAYSLTHDQSTIVKSIRKKASSIANRKFLITKRKALAIVIVTCAVAASVVVGVVVLRGSNSDPGGPGGVGIPPKASKYDFDATDFANTKRWAREEYAARQELSTKYSANEIAHEKAMGAALNRLNKKLASLVGTTIRWKMPVLRVTKQVVLFRGSFSKGGSDFETRPVRFLRVDWMTRYPNDEVFPYLDEYLIDEYFDVGNDITNALLVGTDIRRDLAATLDKDSVVVIEARIARAYVPDVVQVERERHRSDSLSSKRQNWFYREASMRAIDAMNQNILIELADVRVIE